MAQKQKKDPMLVGYMFSYSQEKNPYDFITDPETGLRPQQVSPPKGFLFTRLTDGLQYATVPPLQVWKEGEWLNDIEGFDYQDTGIRPSSEESYDTWVTSGDGTPGNFLWRLYLLPRDLSRSNLYTDLSPKHPMMWPKKFKERKSAQSVKKGDDMGGYKWTGSGYGQDGVYSGNYSWSPQNRTTPAKPAAPALPVGIRIRCTGCGHFFRVDDLQGHVECCPQKNGGFTDWVIACECCDRLDDTAMVKPGFPRDPVVVPVKEVTEDGVGAAAPERAPDSPVDAA